MKRSVEPFASQLFSIIPESQKIPAECGILVSTLRKILKEGSDYYDRGIRLLGLDSIRFYIFSNFGFRLRNNANTLVRT
jgi:hypothetical protein